MTQSLNFFAQVRMLKEGKQKGRMYLHNNGILGFGQDPIGHAKKEFYTATDFLHDHGKSYPWVIGILWGKRQEHIVELFVYSGIQTIQEWPGNPDVDYGQFHSGQFIEKPQGLTCEDGLIVLGKESYHRRNCRSLDHYLTESPRFPLGDIRIHI